MALRGDAVDNIPGAPGIGDKGSVDLIVEFGSLDAVLERSSEVKRKSYRESLEQNRTPSFYPRNSSLSIAMSRSRLISRRWRHNLPTSRPAANFSPSLNSPPCSRARAF